MYKQTRSTVATEVQGATFLSATTDLWSSSASQPYLSCTEHFINKIGSCALGACRRCSALKIMLERIWQSLQDALTIWGLDANKQVCLTTDCGINVVSAVRKFSWTHLPCFGHILHNAWYKIC